MAAVSPQKIIVILNARSGSRDGTRRKAAIHAAFAHHGLTAEILTPTPSRQLIPVTRRALAARPDILVVAGGDGTINAVASVLAGQNQPMGVIPAGTFNYFARAHGVPEDIDGAVRVIVEGTTRATDVAWINDRIFLNNASLGAYSAILQTREGVYDRWGRSRMAAYWSVVKALATFRAPLKMAVTHDGERRQCRTPLVFAMHNAYQLAQMGLPGADHIEQGRLVLLIAPDTGRWGLMKNALALGMGLARETVDYELIAASEIEIALKRRRRAVARDGEISKMPGPFRLRVDRGALMLRVPPEDGRT